MTASIGTHRLAAPAASGQLGSAQGGYGERGNLELVYPDPDDGIWVCWRNHDEDAVGDVAPDEWSSGLRFARGHRYDAAVIGQMRRGPDFLEVVATAGPAVHRWTWSPGPGFERTGVLTADDEQPVVADLAIVETRRELVVAARAGDRQLVWRADATTYPALDWSPPEVLPLLPGTVGIALRPEDDARTWSAALLRADGVLVCKDVSAQDWRPVAGAGHASALTAVTPTRAAPDRGRTAYVVSAGGELVGLDIDGRRTCAASAPGGVDALTACESVVAGQRRVHVVTRRASTLTHLTLG